MCLLSFNNNGGPKIRERDTQIKMVFTFKDTDEDSDFSRRLVLSETQIKSWFSSLGIPYRTCGRVVNSPEKSLFDETEIFEMIQLIRVMIYSLFLDF